MTAENRKYDRHKRTRPVSETKLFFGKSMAALCLVRLIPERPTKRIRRTTDLNCTRVKYISEMLDMHSRIPLIFEPRGRKKCIYYTTGGINAVSVADGSVSVCVYVCVWVKYLCGGWFPIRSAGWVVRYLYPTISAAHFLFPANLFSCLRFNQYL